jgi:hypothetical protein
MSEHVHEWHVQARVPRSRAICECGETRDYAWIDVRLNATERLSAGDAATLADAFGRPAPEWEAGMAYAAALEGE